MTARGKRRMPAFATREEEAAFWDTHSLADFEDELMVVEAATVARPLEHHLSVNLDAATLTELSNLAKSLGVGPSTLAATWIAERLTRERRGPLERASRS